LGGDDKSGNNGIGGPSEQAIIQFNPIVTTMTATTKVTRKQDHDGSVDILKDWTTKDKKQQQQQWQFYIIEQQEAAKKAFNKIHFDNVVLGP
jgi:hypothetical protein